MHNDHAVSPSNSHGSKTNRTLLASLMLVMVLASLLLYGRVIHFDFVNYDDDVILVKNQVVHDFDIKSLFAKTVADDYIPLTLMTYAAEYHFFKLDPMIYHLDNLVLHILNCLLIVLLLNELTAGDFFITAIVSLLFAVHPLHVASVAWVTQRKDVLCTFFSLLSFLFYLKFTKKENGSPRFYFTSLLCFAAALLSKGMAITLPIIFLMADYFLLERKESWKRQFLEKLPFFIGSFAIGIIHLFIHDTGTLMAAANFHWTTPLTNSIESLTFYISKSLIPVGLSAFYRQGVVVTFFWQYFLAASVVAGTFMLIFKGRDILDKKLALFSGLFFLISVAPVLQAIPGGNHFAYSDNYFYVPGIGLFIIYAAALREIWVGKKISQPLMRRISYLVLAGIIVIFSMATFKRMQVWANSETLWKDALAKNPNNPVAYFNLAGYYTFDSSRAAEALPLYDKQQELTPDDPLIYFNRAMALNKLGRPDEAILQFQQALKLAPGVKQIYFNLGALYSLRGRYIEALQILTVYKDRDPTDPQVHIQLAKVYEAQGDKAAEVHELNVAEDLKAKQKK